MPGPLNPANLACPIITEAFIAADIKPASSKAMPLVNPFVTKF